MRGLFSPDLDLVPSMSSTALSLFLTHAGYSVGRTKQGWRLERGGKVLTLSDMGMRELAVKESPSHPWLIRPVTRRKTHKNFERFCPSHWRRFPVTDWRLTPVTVYNLPGLRVAESEERRGMFHPFNNSLCPLRPLLFILLHVFI